MKSFYDALSSVIPATEIASKDGLSYLSAASAMRLSGRPEAEFVEFGDKPYLECLGGALVAVDLPVPGTDTRQRMYLPVMDRDNRSMKLDAVTVADINSNRQRCLVKAIATVYGDGMSLYLGADGDGSKAAKMLGVEPTTNLADATPVVATLKDGGGEPYIEWNVGVAVCRITDPTFTWGVVLWDGKPYRSLLGGVMVDVWTNYGGKKQVLSLPVLDGAFAPIPTEKATTFDWNKTVMRALTKCIAFNSGYGLGVYAEDLAGSKKKADAPKKADAKKAEPKAETKVTAPAPAPAPAVSTPAPAPAETKVTADAPAPAQADVKAEAPSPAPAPAESTTAQGPTEAVERFKGVMQSRRASSGIPGLMTLFEALKVSTKFAEADKPSCYAMLVTGLAGLAEGQDSYELVKSMTTYGAMVHVPADARDLVASRVTANYLAAALNDGDEVLKGAPDALVQAGVASDLADLNRLAQLGSVPAATLDLLAELTTASA